MSTATPEERLRIAMDLFEVGRRMAQSRLRREHPEWTGDDVDRAVERWLTDRPGAEFGDCPGRPVSRESRLSAP